MSTYDGKPLSFDSKRHVVNKEPTLTTKAVVEKMYRAHRERIQRSECVIDSHVIIPEFMVEQKWKKLRKKHLAQELNLENEHIYKRLNTTENAASRYTIETERHVQLVDSMKKHMNRLRESDRVRKIMQIQRENEYMFYRLQAMKPKMPIADMEKWYEGHEKFKEGRLEC